MLVLFKTINYTPVLFTLKDGNYVIGNFILAGKFTKIVIFYGNLCNENLTPLTVYSFRKQNFLLKQPPL